MRFPGQLAAGALVASAGVDVGAALPTVAASAPVASSGGMLQAGLGMLLVLVLIFALAWLARRLGLQRLGGSSVVKVVSSASVGTRERIVVVEVAGTWLVLGVTPSQVNTLHSLPAQAAAPGSGSAGAASNPLGLFSGRLREALGGRPA